MNDKESDEIKKRLEKVEEQLETLRNNRDNLLKQKIDLLIDQKSTKDVDAELERLSKQISDLDLLRPALAKRLMEAVEDEKKKQIEWLQNRLEELTQTRLEFVSGVVAHIKKIAGEAEAWQLKHGEMSEETMKLAMELSELADCRVTLPLFSFHGPGKGCSFPLAINDFLMSMQSGPFKAELAKVAASYEGPYVKLLPKVE